MDTPIFYLFLFVHLISLIVGFGSVLVTDFFGLLWLRRKIDLQLMVKISGHTKQLVWLGWGGLVASGIGLITLKGYLDNLTELKLFFVVMVGVNGIFMHKIHAILGGLNGAVISKQLKFRIAVTSAISQIGWWGAIMIGFVHRHWRHNIPWPESPWLYMLIIFATFIILTLIGELILNKGKDA